MRVIYNTCGLQTLSFFIETKGLLSCTVAKQHSHKDDISILTHLSQMQVNKGQKERKEGLMVKRKIEDEKNKAWDYLYAKH